jgi:hypothetical protein
MSIPESVQTTKSARERPVSAADQKSDPANASSARALYLSSRQVKTLFGYYFLILIASFATAVGVFIPGPLSKFGYVELSLIGSCAMACVGSSVFYLRKLYKSVLNDALVTDTDGSPLKAAASFIYFAARPLFAIAFALLVVIGIKSGLVLSGAPQTGLNYGFIQLTMFFSFFVGFLAGKFVRQLESWGETMLQRLTAEDRV